MAAVVAQAQARFEPQLLPSTVELQQQLVAPLVSALGLDSQ